MTDPVTIRAEVSGDASMHRQQRSLLTLNLIGGAAVLASYAIGLGSAASDAEALWGGVPAGLRPVYTANMFLAAAGYFLFTPYIALRLQPGQTRIAGRFGYASFHLLYALVLLPSALWLELTQRMIAQPSAWMWVAIRLDLALVGLGSIGLLAALLTLDGPRPRGRALAIVGLLPFCLQTAVLDALVWPALFAFPS